MVKHVILWQLKDELSTEEKSAVKAGIKEGLESLSGKIPGLVDIHMHIESSMTYPGEFSKPVFHVFSIF